MTWLRDNNTHLNGELEMAKDDCEKCHGENFILLGCCDGLECGCEGQPVSVTNCKTCNPDGLAEMGEYVAHYDHLEYVGD